MPVAVAVAAGLLAGVASARPPTPVPAAGRLVVEGRVGTDPVAGRVVVRAGAAFSVTGPVEGLAVGDTVRVAGSFRPRPHRVGRTAVVGELAAVEVIRLRGSGDPALWIGNLVRRRVGAVFGGGRDDDALLRGFLVGDTTGLDPVSHDELRRAGLVHLVAVSGSNVALFLTGWWIVTYPLAVRPRTRAVVGLVGLAVFAAATRWEPSVLRASTMAAVVLVFPVLGAVVDAWAALGIAVGILVLAAPDLTGSVGFQLSVAATAGVLAGAVPGSGGPVRRWVVAALRTSLAAQVAVAPILLWRFGTVPLLAPVANLVAVPVAAVGTVLGALAALGGFPPLVAVARVPARLVLELASAAASWPQLDPVQAAGVGILLLAWRIPGCRPLVVGGLVGLAVVGLLGGPAPPPVPEVVFLDVGQGDAVLLVDPEGTVVAVDGGADPVRWHRALLRRGIGRIDLLVATHGDLDHVGGLAGVFGRREIGRLWYPEHPELGPTLEALVADARALGVAAEPAPVGATVRVGRFRIEVLGPRRRYRSQNDGSVVLLVSVEETSVLLAGDVEAVAQRELPPVHPDVLLVPHHGAETSDLEWLAATVGRRAVISVGAENPYGHPGPEVVARLLDAGAAVSLTSRDGDVAFALDS